MSQTNVSVNNCLLRVEHHWERGDRDVGIPDGFVIDSIKLVEGNLEDLINTDEGSNPWEEVVNEVLASYEADVPEPDYPEIDQESK